MTRAEKKIYNDGYQSKDFFKKPRKLWHSSTLGVFVSMTSVLKCGSVYTVLWVYVCDTTIYVGIFIAFN